MGWVRTLTAIAAPREPPRNIAFSRERARPNHGNDEHCAVTQSAYGAHGPPGPHADVIAELHAPDCASFKHVVHVESGADGVAAQNVEPHCDWQTLGVHAQSASAVMKPS